MKYKNLDFVAHTCVQKVLTDVWAGKLDIRQVASFRAYLCVALVIFFPFFMPMIDFNEEEIKKSDSKSYITQYYILCDIGTQCISTIIQCYPKFR